MRSVTGRLAQRSVKCHVAQAHSIASPPVVSQAQHSSSPQLAKANVGERARSHLNSAFPSLDFAELDAQVYTVLAASWQIVASATFAHNHGLLTQTGRVRIRQHVNPLKRELQTPAEPPVWQDVFADPSLPLCVDIGSGGGRFLLALSKQMPAHNCIGLEIRRAVREMTLLLVIGTICGCSGNISE